MIYECVDIMSRLATQTKCKQLNHMMLVINHLLSHATHETHRAEQSRAGQSRELQTTT